jgi:hypothetical protein
MTRKKAAAERRTIREFARFLAATSSQMMGWLLYDKEDDEVWATYCAQGQTDLRYDARRHILLARDGDCYKAHGQGEAGRKVMDMQARIVALVDEARRTGETSECLAGTLIG